MSRSLAVGRMLSGRRSPAPLRRYLRSRPNSIAEEIASLSDEQRALMSNHLGELDAELQSRLVNASFESPTKSNHRGILNRVSVGERDDRLIWRSILAAGFLGSALMIQWESHRCARYHDKYQERHEEKAAAPATANHAA